MNGKFKRTMLEETLDSCAGVGCLSHLCLVLLSLLLNVDLLNAYSFSVRKIKHFER